MKFPILQSSIEVAGVSELEYAEEQDMDHQTDDEQCADYVGGVDDDR